MNIVAIVQARMGSKRLPGKMLLQILGRPIVEHVITRVQQATRVQSVWLATTVNAEDDALVLWAKAHEVPCYRGSSEDVLDRYYHAAQLAKANVVIRITGDCPLTDPAIIDRLVSEYTHSGVDYVSTVHPPTYPDGYDVEIFSFAALARAWRDAKLTSEREHVTPYIWKHPELFRLKNMPYSEDVSSYRCTLDTAEDFKFLNIVIGACAAAQSVCDLSLVLQLLRAHPEWLKINSQYERNEGYKKSVASEKPKR